MNTQTQPENNFVEVVEIYAIAFRNLGWESNRPAEILYSTVSHDYDKTLERLDELAFSSSTDEQYYVIKINGGDCMTGERGVKPL